METVAIKPVGSSELGAKEGSRLEKILKKTLKRGMEVCRFHNQIIATLSSSIILYDVQV